MDTTLTFKVEMYIHEEVGKYYPGVKLYQNGQFVQGYFLQFFYTSPELAKPMARRLMAEEMAKHEDRMRRFTQQRGGEHE